MRQRGRSMVIGAYLLLCILLGGSAQGVWSNLILQVAGLLIIVFAASVRRHEEEGSNAPAPYALLGLGLLVVLLQLIPLAPGIWTGLPGRSSLAGAYALLGEQPPALPISEAPYQSVMTLFAAIPAIAVFLAVACLKPSPRWLAIAVIAGTVFAIVLGAIQVSGGRDSWAYFYPISNGGAVGTFANRNHMGTLLIVSIPFGAAMLASSKSRRRGSLQGKVAIGVAAVILVAVGIALNGSLAAFALTIPVVIASASVLPEAVRWRWIGLPIAVVALIGGAVLLATTPIATITSETGAESSVESRQVIWTLTSEAIADSFPVGTGLGTFQGVYRQHENPADVTTEYVNHAHNDYLELALELGLPGMIVIFLVLAWWLVTAVSIWRSPLSTSFGRAATIASAAVLVHSAVDYPLRTAAISSIFAACMALMAQRARSEPERERKQLRPTRHVKLG